MLGAHAHRCAEGLGDGDGSAHSDRLGPGNNGAEEGAGGAAGGDAEERGRHCEWSEEREGISVQDPRPGGGSGSSTSTVGWAGEVAWLRLI